MIYPEFFPEERKNEISELKMFEKLKSLSDQYDIFYSKKFVTDGVGKKSEIEIDFIVTIPNYVLICLEIKGGMIQYNGELNTWSQNGKIMSKNPDIQASSAAHFIIKNYSEELSGMAVGWGLCFTDCQVSDKSKLPINIKEEQIIDELSIIYLDDALKDLIGFIKTQNPHRLGIKYWQYEKFKNDLLRNLGFAQLLGTRIKGQEKEFIQLTQYQLDLFNRAVSNNNLITTGPAGSGKTIAAKILAKDLLKNGEKVLFLCFNRTLANKIRYEFDKNENEITVTTFHSFSKRLIDTYDPQWWDEVKSKSDDFWSFEVPVKLSEYIDDCAEIFDTLIIDEGQDFKEFWYEILFKLVASHGKKYIFLDENQNIFENFTTIPNENIFFKYHLPENCRNTKTIVNYLSDIINREIKSFGSSPIGEAIVNKVFGNLIELQKYLIEEVKELVQNQNLDPSQILFMLNTTKDESSISNLTKIRNMKIEAVDNKGRLQSNCINYTTINQFKGLEADVVFILDANKIINKKLEKLYTEASRARFKLYVIDLKLH